MKYLLLLGLIGVFGTITHLSAQQSDQNPVLGQFTIVSNLEEFILLVDDDLNNPIYYTVGDTIQVPVGEHSFRGVREEYHDAKFKATIYPDQVIGQQINFSRPKNVAPRSSYQVIEYGYNVSIYSEEGAEIFVDQELVGYTQVNVLLADGKHELFINHPDYGTIFTKIVTAIDEPKIEHRYFTDYRKIPKATRLIPGVGYLLDDKRGAAFLTVSGLATLLYYQGYASAKADQIQSDKNLYERWNPTSGPLHDKKLADFDSDIKKFNRRSTLSIISAGVLYVATTYHTLQRPKEGYKKPPVQFNMQAFNEFGEVSPQFHLTLNF